MTRPSAPSEATVAIARRLAAAHPAAKLPCPACGASLRADNFNRHLEKVHGAVAPTKHLADSWAGADRKILRPLIAGTILVVIASFALLAVTPDELVRAVAGIMAVGMFAGLGLIGLTALGKLGARLTLEGDALRLRWGLGLRRSAVRLPATLEAGRVFWMRLARATRSDEVHGASTKEGSGSYLRLTNGPASLTIRCPHDCAFAEHWAGVQRGPKRDRYDISLDRATFAALEYALAERGLLTVRTG
jgi:hypothetical protein